MGASCWAGMNVSYVIFKLSTISMMGVIAKIMTFCDSSNAGPLGYLEAQHSAFESGVFSVFNWPSDFLYSISPRWHLA